MGTTSDRLVLRDLTLPTRLVLSAFLIAVGLGYFSALVQLHFQQAPAGQLLPGKDEAEQTYAGKAGMSQLERLLTADEHLPFNGTGSMRAAFTTRGVGWTRQIRETAEALKLDPKKPRDLAQAEEHLRAERNLEILALVDWIHEGAPESSYESYVLPGELAAKLGPEPDDTYFEKRADGKWTAKLKQIIDHRCVRCHKTGRAGPEGQVHLDQFAVVKDYVEASTGGTGMSLTKLAQTTHAHLLSFAVLFGLTGLVFTFTSYWGWVRGLFGLWTLTAQVAEICCWWLGRADPVFAHAILVTGGLVATGLLIQIFGSLFNMYGTPGKTILLLLILLACAGGVTLHGNVIQPFLEVEQRLRSSH